VRGVAISRPGSRDARFSPTSQTVSKRSVNALGRRPRRVGFARQTRRLEHFSFKQPAARLTCGREGTTCSYITMSFVSQKENFDISLADQSPQATLRARPR
jgi:hypothetical protein